MAWSGGVDRLPSGAYRARLRVGSRRLQASFSRRVEAEAWLRARLLEKASGTVQKPETLEAARTRVLAEMAARGYRPSYLIDFRSLSQRVVQALGPKTAVSLITRDAIKAYAASLKHAPSTRRNLLNALSKLVGGLPKGTRPRVVCKCRHVPTSADLSALLEQSDPAGRMVLLLAADAGLRRGEIAALQPRDVREGWLVVQGKGGVVRWVPVLTARLAAALTGPWHGCRTGHGVHSLIFSQVGHSPLHGLRHRWVSVLAASGRVSPHELAAWAGHSVTISMRYFHPATLGSRTAGSLVALGESSGLENRRGASHRGFESRPLRQDLTNRVTRQQMGHERGLYGGDDETGSDGYGGSRGGRPRGQRDD